MTAIYIALFGLAGIFSRYGADLFFSSRFPNFQFGTVVVNVIGCFLAGVIYVLGIKESFSPQIQTALLVGFCGGFTTFSAYALQSLLMNERGSINIMLINFIGSPLLGLAAVYIGYLSTKLVIR